MKKLLSTLKSTKRTFQNHSGINKMLTPFLFSLFLLSFLSEGVAQEENCPKPRPECEIFEKSTAFDIGTLIGSTGSGCVIEFKYKERLCPSNEIEVFDVETNPQNWSWSNINCLTAYNNFVNSVASQGTTAINDFILKQEILLSEAALQLSTQQFVSQNPNFLCPNGFITGRSFFKTCSVSCMKWVEKPFGIENPVFVYFLDISKIPCGTTCCTSVQRFCLNPNNNLAEPIGPKTFSSDNILGCDKNTSVKGCEKKWGYFGKSSCIIACEYTPKKLVNEEVIKDDISSIEINNKIGIKASILNNSSTKTILVSFMSDFVGTISLFDISGRQVFNTDVNTNEGGLFYILTEQFNSGLYFINIKDKNDNMLTEKVIVK
jgi:hypothetical protein